MDDSIRATILSIFERYRERPEAPFEEARFLHFLMADNRPLKDVRNSFKGLRRLNAFYDALQLECAVCLDAHAPEKDWPLDKLAQLIAEKKKNPRAQKTFVRQRSQQADRDVLFEPFKFAVFLIAPVVAVAWAIADGGIVGWSFVALGVIADFAIYLLARREAVFYTKLRQAIES